LKPFLSQHVGIALGSNLGNRLANIQIARDVLRSLAVPDAPFLQAPIYQTSPVGCPEGSPDFYNTVVTFEFVGTPFDLIDRTQEIEARLGRVSKPERNAPREIDVDILYFGVERLNTGALVLPHPRLTQRRFVLQPLADVQPDLTLPGDTATIAQHLHSLDSAESPLVLVEANW
jgi:2-amino-4-hydroxy-6-hydroxymethyldihydropteridine diphosphokinase